jgi:hypothetical protein
MISNCLFLLFQGTIPAQRLEISASHGVGIWQGFVPTAAMFARDASSVQKTLAEVKNADFWQH